MEEKEDDTGIDGGIEAGDATCCADTRELERSACSLCLGCFPRITLYF